jgi:hypothetical protein
MGQGTALKVDECVAKLLLTEKKLTGRRVLEMPMPW